MKESKEYSLKQMLALKRSLFGLTGHLTGKKVSQQQLENALIQNNLAKSENVGKLIKYFLQGSKRIPYHSSGAGMELIKEENNYSIKKHNFYQELSIAIGNIMDDTIDEGAIKKVHQMWVDSDLFFK